MAHIHIGNASENGDVAVFLVPVGEMPGVSGHSPIATPLDALGVAARHLQPSPLTCAWTKQTYTTGCAARR